MTKRTGKAEATQAGNRTSGALAEALTPLIAGMTATRTHLLEWVHTLGIEALQAVFAAEAEALAGPKGRHQRERTYHHWGRTATELTFGGRRIQVARPRVRSCEGQEAVLNGGLSSARKDVASPDQKFKKVYIESKYPPDVMERKFAEWEGLKRRLFISKR